MKVDTGINPVVSFGVQNKVECGIARNAKAFRVLYKSLYSDPIKAIIRELSVNGRDSQVAAGNGNKPFLVTLPNWTSNLFSVRDYGTGMSRDKIEGPVNPDTGKREGGLYSTFFASDKEDTNELTGFLGIGSKSPLAYTRQFNITSYQNGVRYMYTLLLNERELPELNFFGECETNEPNGVEVSFAVDGKDYNTFANKAKEVFKYFAVQPKVTGQPFSHHTISTVFDEPGWKYLKENTWGIQATMGDVAYPVDSSLLPVGYTDFGRLPLLIKFNIGDIDMTASREALEYTPKTIKALTDKLDTIKKFLVEKTQERVGSSKSYFETCCNLHLLKNSPNFSPFWDIVKNDIKFPSFTRNVKASGNISDYLDKTYDNYKLSQYRFGSYTRIVTHSFEFTPDVYVVVNDTGSMHKGKNRACYFSSGKKVYYVSHKNGDYKELEEVFDNGKNFVKVSTLPDPPPGQYNHGPTYINKVRGKVNTFCLIHNYINCSWDERGCYSSSPERVDICLLNGEERVYGLLHRNKICMERSTASKLMALLGKNLTVHGIKSVDIDKVKKAKGWIHIDDYLKRETEALAVSLKVSDYVAEIRAKGQLSCGWLWNMQKLSISDTLQTPHLYNQIKDRFDFLSQFSNKILAVLELCTSLNITINNSKPSDLKTLEDDFVKKYKFLSVIDSYKIQRQPKLIEEIISALDK